MSVANNGGYKCICPACGNRMRIRNSESQTPLFKTMYAQCTFVPCSLAITGSLSWDYQLNSSGIDSPQHVLPLSPAMRKMQALKDSRPKTDQIDLLDQLETESTLCAQ